MTKSLSTLHAKLKIMDLPAQTLLPMLQLALVQNCVVGIRHEAIFGLIPKVLLVDGTDVGGALQQAALTMDFYSSAALSSESQDKYIQEAAQQFLSQWSYLCQDFDRARQLKMSVPLLPAPSPKHMQFDLYRWQRLLEQLSPLLHHAQPDFFVASGVCRVAGLNVQLFYSVDRPLVFELRMDLGALPESMDKLSVFQALLAHNHFSGHETGLWWGVHPVTLHPIIVMLHQLSTSERFFSAPSAHDMFILVQDSVREASKFWENIRHEVQRIQGLLDKEI